MTEERMPYKYSPTKCLFCGDEQDREANMNTHIEYHLKPRSPTWLAGESVLTYVIALQKKVEDLEKTINTLKLGIKQ